MDAMQELDQLECRMDPGRYRSAAKGRLLFYGLLIAAFLCGLVCGAALCSAEEGIASWYSTETCRINPDSRCPTADGSSLYDLERQGVRFAASWHYPFGTRLRVCRADRHTICATVVVRDRGPARRLGRTIDLSRLAFEALGDPRRGTVQVTLERLR